MSLDNIKIVLVGTTHPGNIGAAARAMKAMGLTRLALVRPKIFPHAEATARAAGADDLLARAELHDNLADALANCRLAVATSARERRLDWPGFTAREFGGIALREARLGEVAVVFGRENNGLSNEELDLCNRLVHIRANPEFGSLNLGAAVQVMAYEVYTAWLLESEESGVQADGADYATATEVEGFFSHLETTLLQISFFGRRYSPKLVRRLRRLLYRIRPDRTEINILRGILTAIGKDQAPLDREPESPGATRPAPVESAENQ